MAVKNKDRNLFGGGGRGSDEAEQLRLRNKDKELTREVDALEREIDELRATYELFFMGVEKVEPQPQRDLLKSKLRRFQENKPRNTAIKFRVQQLKARMVSLENYWQRTMRQKEAGTYHRDIARLKRREAERLKKEQLAQRRSEPEAESVDIVESGDSIVADDARAVVTPRTARAGTTSSRPRATSAEDLTDDKLKKIYDTYVGARRRCGESTDLQFDEMASALRKQVPRLIKKTGAGSVEFKVVIKSGKAVLKALPRSRD